MGKQTNINGSQFGGEWTLQKLHIIDEYLKSYSKKIKSSRFIKNERV